MEVEESPVTIILNPTSGWAYFCFISKLSVLSHDNMGGASMDAW